MGRDHISSAGPYRLLSRLGHGGMGVVYLGKHVEGEQEVAVKTLRVDSVQTLRRLQREIEALSRLDHPSVVKVFDHGMEGDVPWYAMELLRGQTLNEALAMERTPTAPTAVALPRPSSEAPPLRSEVVNLDGKEPDARTLSEAQFTLLGHMIQVCRALAYVHGEGVVHCDLKPDNIFLTDAGKVVLVDFGIATQAMARLGADSMEVAGLLAGTAHYISPERIEGAPFDARSDLYSVGCILYEIVTGQRPFESSQADRVLARHLHDLPTPPSALGWMLPKGLEALILRLMAKQPGARPGHAQAVQHALESLQGVVTPPDLGGPTPQAFLYKPALTGRSELVARIEAHLEDATRGQGGMCLLKGESGVGKTRVAVEMIQIARRRRMEVLIGQATTPTIDRAGIAAAQSSPLSLFRRPLAQIAGKARQLGPDEVQRVFGITGRLLAPLIDELPVGPADPPAPLGSAQVIDALDLTLRAHCGDRPLLLVLDDLHWADATSLNAIEGLLSSIRRGRPWMILAMTRAEEHREEILRLMDTGDVETYPVQRLDTVAVGQIVAQMLGSNSIPEALALRVHTLTLGNPLFVAELLMLAVEQGLIALDDTGVWHLKSEKGRRAADVIAALPLPTTIQSLLVDRLVNMPHGALKLCEAAAVLGKPMEEAQLHHLFGGGMTDFLNNLDELRRREIISDGPGLHQLHFVHDKIREVTYGRMHPRRRRALHIKVARRMSASEGVRVDIGGLAWHWNQGGERERARLCYLEAAELAAGRYAYPDADHFYPLALSLTEPNEPFHWRVQLSRVKNILMVQGRHPEAEAILSDALAHSEAFERDPHLLLEAELTLGRLLSRTGRTLEGLDLLKSAHARATALSDRRREGESMTAQASALLRLGRHAESEALFERAIEVAREVQNTEDEALALTNLAILFLNRSQLDEAEAPLRRALELRRALGDLRGESDSLANLAIFHIHRGRSRTAIETLEHALAIKKTIRDLQGESIVLNNLAVLLHQQGRRLQAYGHLTLALDIERRIQDRRATANTLINLGMLCTDQGLYDEAMARLTEALEIALLSGNKRTESYALYGLGALCRAEARWEDAEEHLSASLNLSHKLEDRHLEGLALLNLAELRRHQRRLPEAATALERAQEIFAALDDQRSAALALCEAGFGALAAGQSASTQIALARELAEEICEDGLVETLNEVIDRLERADLRRRRGEELVAGQCREDLPQKVVRRLRGDREEPH